MAKSYNVLILSLLVLYCKGLWISVDAQKLAPCYFVFGDSLFDNGNNNARNTFAKANYPPYGIDFPGGPTGRFSNGRNVADFIAEYLGFADHIPPFASASGDTVLSGVNYASGGAGILPLTGKQFGDVISLEEQLQQHGVTINAFKSILGDADSAKKNLRKCVYLVGMGSNDYAAYAGMLINRPTPDAYAQLLIDQYSGQLRGLYAYGARKVGLIGLGTIGCVPGGGAILGPICLTTTKATSGVFNDKLKSLVDVLNKELVGANFTYIDTFGITVSDPSFQAFKVRNAACCAVAGIGCVVGGVTCANRSDFEYFDGVHPSEAAARIVAKRAFVATSSSDAYPIDFRRLALAPTP